MTKPLTCSVKQKPTRSNSISSSNTLPTGLDLPDLLGESGPFAQLIDGFQARPQQQAMLQAVQTVMQTQGTCGD
jgi:hypothetical protein